MAIEIGLLLIAAGYGLISLLISAGDERLGTREDPKPEKRPDTVEPIIPRIQSARSPKRHRTATDEGGNKRQAG